MFVFDALERENGITYERPRELLKKAKNDYEMGLINKALLNTALSFIYLMNDYEKSKISHYKSPFDIGESMLSLKVDWFGNGPESHDINTFISNVSKSITDIQEILKMLCFGINIKKYIKFKTIAPSVQYDINGIPCHHINDELLLKKEDFEFCISFIVESAIKLQEFDFEIRI